MTEPRPGWSSSTRRASSPTRRERVGLPDVGRVVRRSSTGSPQAFGERVVFTRFVAPTRLGGSWRATTSDWPFALVPGRDPLYAVVPELAAYDRHVVTAPTFGKWNPALRAIVGDQPRSRSPGSPPTAASSPRRCRRRRRGDDPVVADACAGSSADNHAKALDVMALFGPLVSLATDRRGPGLAARSPAPLRRPSGRRSCQGCSLCRASRGASTRTSCSHVPVLGERHCRRPPRVRPPASRPVPAGITH